MRALSKITKILPTSYQILTNIRKIQPPLKIQFSPTYNLTKQGWSHQDRKYTT